MQRDLLNSKFRAFAIHFGISLLIFLSLLYFILFQWYPQPFFSTDGGWQGIRLITFVDLILGPALTFVIFNPEKVRKLLIMDLSIIGICQIVALSWGTWAVHNERPYLLVFSDGGFYPLTYYQVNETGLKKSDIKNISPAPPPIKIYVDIPTDKQEYFALLTTAAQTKPIHFMGTRYKRFDNNILKQISSRNINMEAYLQGEPEEWRVKYQAFLKTVGNEINNVLFFPLNARYGKHIVAFNKSTMDIIEVLNIPPPSIRETLRGKN